MRLREVGERVEELIDSAWDELMLGPFSNGLLNEPKTLPACYRQATTGVKGAGSVGWQVLEFAPDASLIEPFRLYPSRYVALVRVHRQSSGILELATHISSIMPGPNESVKPHFYCSFSSSKNVETTISVGSEAPDQFSFQHTGALLDDSGQKLPAEFCLPGFESALPAVEALSNDPGLLFENDAAAGLNIGRLQFYNQGRTPDRRLIRDFIANNIALAMVARSVESLVKKSMSL